MTSVYEKTETVLVKMEQKELKGGENGENLETSHADSSKKYQKVYKILHFLDNRCQFSVNKRGSSPISLPMGAIFP